MLLRKLSNCHQDVRVLIDKIANILSLSDIDYTILTGSEDIDTFFSALYNVNIRGCRDGQKVKFNLILRCHHDSKSRTVLRKYYKREIVFYHRIVPRYLEIQRNFNIIEGLQIKFPNCILASDEFDKEAVVIMGLIENGFRLHDRFKRFDLSHVVLVMKYLAKLHAFSFILERWRPKEFDEIKKIFNKDLQYSDPNRQSPMNNFFDASVNVISDPVIKKKMEDLSPNISAILHKSTLPTPPFSVFCHGDCWNNNILYKYMSKRAVDVILVDFQLMRLASPVTDIAYLLYMSTDREFLSKHYETVINTYYGTLSAVLRECSYDVKEVYPKEVFEVHLREYSVLGLVEALISMMIITAPFEEALKMTEIKYEVSDSEISHSEDNVLFINRVNDVVTDFFSRNFSLDAVLTK